MMIGRGRGYGHAIGSQGGLLNVIELQISNANETEITDAIIPIIVHKETNTGEATGRDIWLNNTVADDFIDLKFEDNNGNELQRYIANNDSVGMVFDSKLPSRNSIIDNGVIIGANISGVTTGIAKSIDNGKTWTVLYPTTSNILFKDSRGYYYACSANKIIRSIDGGENWAAVYDMTDVTGSIESQGITEDVDGNIYIGRYQGDTFAPKIVKSTDGGATFITVFDATTQPARPRNTDVALLTLVRPATANGKLYICTVAGKTADTTDPVWPTTLGGTVTDGTVTWKESGMQHVHCIGADPFTGYIYATWDGIAKMIRSIDKGITWQVIINKQFADLRSVVFGDGYRLWGAGATGSNQVGNVYKTTDDVNFIPVISNAHTCQGLKKIGTDIFAFTNSLNPLCNYPAIYKSSDDGDTWKTIWQSNFDNQGGFAGYWQFSDSGILNNQTQILLSGRGTGYKNARLIVGLKQALCYLKVPTVAVGNSIIKAKKATATNVNVFPKSSVSPILRLKLDDGIGNPLDSSGNNYATTLATGGLSGWLNEGGRLAGHPYTIPLFNKSYSFKGDGYIQVTGSGAFPNKSLTAFAWMRSNVLLSPSRIFFGKGDSENVWSFGINAGGLIFIYGNGTTSTNIGANLFSSGGSPKAISDNKWHMLGIIIDNSSPPKISFIFDGLTFDTNKTIGAFSDMSYEPNTGTKLFRLGADTANGRMLTADMSDFQLYDKVLTATEIRSIYEDRPIALTEPTINNI